MDRLIDPVIADLQAETEFAATTAQRTRVWVLGHIALFTVMVCYGAEQLIRTPLEDDRAAILNAAATFGATAAMCTALLTAAPYLHFAWRAHPLSAMLALLVLTVALIRRSAPLRSAHKGP
jgi:hypothetical protein